MTAATLYTCLGHYLFDPTAQHGTFQLLLLLGLFLLSVPILFLMIYGAWFTMQRRRTHGVDWWGADLESEVEMALEMTFSTFSVVAGCWLSLVSLTLEVYLAPFGRSEDFRMLGLK